MADHNHRNAQIQAHRSLFARRWLKYRGKSVLGVEDTPAVAATRGPFPGLSERDRPIAVLYTPFDLTTGGGERYFLSVASALSRRFDIAICSKASVSTARVRFALNALGVAPFPFRILTWDELIIGDRPDLFFAMGNEIVPPVPPIGRRNWFHLQFPFPWRQVGVPVFSRLLRYDRIIVNSEFTASWTSRRMTEAGLRKTPPISVLYPPVRKPLAAALPMARRNSGERDYVSVVNVGRFFVGGHSKRQNVFLDIIEEANRRSDRPIRGTLIGSVFDDPPSVAFFREIQDRAKASGMVRVIVDASHHELFDELSQADVYLHCGGIGVAEEAYPERLEHFGISIVEAIFSGCYPLVYETGGPREILNKGKLGKGYRTVGDAAAVLRDFAKSPDVYLRQFDSANWQWLDRLTDAAFAEQIGTFVESSFAVPEAQDRQQNDTTALAGIGYLRRAATAG